MRWIFTSFSSQDLEINVQCQLFVGEVERRCAAPFSWLVNAYCQSLWEESEFVQGKVSQGWPVC